jgi:hypothetical protein
MIGPSMMQTRERRISTPRTHALSALSGKANVGVANRLNCLRPSPFPLVSFIGSASPLTASIATSSAAATRAERSVTGRRDRMDTSRKAVPKLAALQYAGTEFYQCSAIGTEARFAIWRQSLVKYSEERSYAAARSVKFFTLNPMPGNSQ